MNRRRFSEREVLETLWHIGYDLRCYRCKESLWSASNLLDKVEREHITELALGGKDEPRNCAYSHKSCHHLVTNGSKATSAGSSKQRIAKVRRLRGETKPKRKRIWPSKPIPSRPFSKR